MEITSINYSKTIQSGQYEPETLGAQATLEAGDDFEKCATSLRAQVTSALGRKADASASTKSTAKAGKGAKATATKDADAKASTKPEKPKADKPKTAKKKKDVEYNREVKAHQTEMGKVLALVSPDWKSDL